MDVMLSTETRQFAVVNPDDVTIFSRFYGRESGPPIDCTGTTLKGQRMVDTEEMLLDRGLYRILGSFNSRCLAQLLKMPMRLFD